MNERSPVTSAAFPTLLLAGLCALGSIACSKHEPQAAQAASAPGDTAATATTAATTTVTEGSPAPDFSVKASDGTDLKLAALRGKPVVLYFYPKDETPGCTTEACSFRDAWNQLSTMNVVLIGVSADSDESHRKFAEHHHLPFHLVSDEGSSLAKRYGVPMFGRQTFVIDANGNVKKIFRSVDVTVHAREIEGILKT